MRRIAFAFAVLTLAALACVMPGGEEEPTETPTPAATNTPEGKPTVVIDAPPSGAETAVDQEVFVQSTSNDAAGVTRVVLEVDGVQVSSDESPDPEGQPTFTLLQSWTPTASGTYNVSVTAFRGDGTASDPANITVSVVEEEELAEPLPPPPMLANLPPTQTTGPCQNIIRTHLNVRTGPDVSNDKVYTFSPGSVVPVNGQNSNGSWRYVDYPGGQGWMSAGHDYSYSSGDCSNLQVVDDTANVTPSPDPDITLTPEETLETQESPTYAPDDNDYDWSVGRDDGTVQFAEMVSYPEGDTEDRITFEISDLTQDPGDDSRDVTFTMICTPLEGSSAENLMWGTDAQGQGLSCGESLNMTYMYGDPPEILVVIIETGPYAYVQYTINAIITAP